MWAIPSYRIVSSDADFAPLATRFRKQGLPVFGYGSIGAAVTFRGSCTSYIFIENLHPDAPANNPATAMKPLRPPAALEDSNGQEGWVMHEDLGRSLARQHVDFDTRTYVFRSVRDLLCKLPRIHLDNPNDGVIRARHQFSRKKQLNPKVVPS